MAATIGTGATVTFSSGYLAEIISIQGSGTNRASIATSHLGTTGGMTYIPAKLYDPGTLTVELQMVPGTTPITPLTAAAETITVTFPDTGAATYAASGFMTGFDYSIPLEDRVTQTVNIQFSGNITVTP